MARAGRKAARPGRGPKGAMARPVLEPAPAVALAVFALVTLVFFWPHLSGGAFLWEDFREFTYPNWVFAARNVAAGTIPYWNPFTFNGMPFTADLQVGFYYPVNLLMFFFSSGDLSPWLAQFVVIMHFPVAMIGMWMLARTLGLNFWGSMLSGLAFGLTGMLVVHAIHANMVQHLAWFPLVVHFYYRGMMERSVRHAILSGVALGIAFLSGHPQSSLYIVLFLFSLALFLLIRTIRSGSATRLATMAICGAVPVIIAGGLFAVQFLQTQELAGLSERAEMSYEKSLEGKLTPGSLITLVAPKYFGVTSPNADSDAENPYWNPPEQSYLYWETTIYIGVVVLVLALVGLLTRRLGSFGIFIASMALFGLLYAIGDSFFVHQILGRAPLFSSFRIPTRMAIFLSFGGALLAGAGLDRLTRGEVDVAGARRALIAGGSVAILSLVVVSGLANGFYNPPEGVASTRSAMGVAGLLLAVASTGLSFAALRGKAPGALIAIVLTVLAVGDLFGFGFGQNQSDENPGRDVYEASDAQYSQFKAVPPDKLFRVKMREGSTMLMPRNQGPYSGIMLYEGYNPLLLARRVPPTGDLAVRANLERAFDLLDIRYDVHVDSTSGTAALVPRATAFPHARIVFDARVVSPEQSKEALSDTSIDLLRSVVLEVDPGVRLEKGGTGQARISEYSASRIVVETDCDRAGILVLSEIWYPSWSVTVDQKPTSLLRANYSLRGVAVPAGKHRVEMTFSSTAADRGLWISIGTAAMAILAVMILRVRTSGGSVRDGSESPIA